MEDVLTLDGVALLVLLATVVERVSEAATGFLKALLRRVNLEGVESRLTDTGDTENYMKPISMLISAVAAWAVVVGFDLTLVDAEQLNDDQGRILTAIIIAFWSDLSHQVLQRIRPRG